MSNRKVWKYQLPWQDRASIAMPKDAQILEAGLQGGPYVGLCIWALVDPNAEPELRHFRLAGTGHPISEDVRHISTIQTQGGELVFHLFEIVGQMAGPKPLGEPELDRVALEREE